MKKLPFITILFTVLVCGYFMKSGGWEGRTGDNWKNTLNGYDSKAYYSYLPAFFIKHTLKITDSTLPYVNVTDKGIFNKHFVGPAVLWSPFFAAALEYSRLKGNHVNAYSALFIKAIGIAALFWLFIGLYCLWKTLKLFDIPEGIISLTILLIFFGTNLFYYSYQEYAMAHLYSFSLLSVFLYTGIKYARTERKIFLVLMCVAFGLSVIVRPTAICLLPCLVPLLCGGIKNMFHIFLKPIPILIFIVVVIPVLFIQCGAWYWETGHWYLRSYADEGFYFFHPQLFKVLFSFQNGWFIYTPVAVLSLTGFINLYKTNRISFYFCSLAIILWWYLVASWWCWSYEDGFEHRAFIDIYPIIAIGLAYLFPFKNNKGYASTSPKGRKRMTGILVFICALCLSLNLVQTYQYYKNILVPYWMDWKSYKYVFLKTSDKYIDCLGGQKDLPPYSNKLPQLVFSSQLNFSQPGESWRFKQPEMLYGKPAIHFAGDEFGTSVEIPADSVYNKGKRYYAKITLSRFEPTGNSSSGVLLVHDDVDTNHHHESYQAFAINDYPSGNDSNSRTYHYAIDIACLKSKGSRMYFYIWNPRHQNFYLTGLSMEIYRVFP